MTCGCGVDQDAEHPADQSRTVKVEEDLLAANNKQAEHIRQHFAAKRILALNLVSSPGAGKTSLLVKTIAALKAEHSIVVIEGDQQTSRDADRIRETGVNALQINTGKGCHLEAHSIHHALHDLELKERSILFIENVGNLVCPAMFDLGEAHKVVILSTPEGCDKPLKYPHMFDAADLMLINKVDLLPYVDFNMEDCIDNAKRVNPKIDALPLSAKTGEGVSIWVDWIKRKLP
jgi:hydrogenase nickel incorporation protein HypB